MTKKHLILLGKSIRKLAALRGGGSALPGLVIERLDPDFLSRCLTTLPHGVIVVSGTNGKTTTTKMVVALLESQGLRVFTNRTGSNFTRGVAAALLGEVSLSGELEADVAVLELDEAHAVHFVKKVSPRYSLLLNVMRDQLDRFGEIDTTARLLEKIAQTTTDTVILNREDPRVRRIDTLLPQATRASYFGLNPALRSAFPNDDDLHSKAAAKTSAMPNATVTLDALSDNGATFIVGSKKYTTALKVTGVYNIFNAAAALALVKAVCPDANDRRLIEAIATVEPAFGRGETVTVNGQPLELILVKNPAGFQLALSSFNPGETATMIAINDNYADGRDMSWLWDVDFTSLKESGVAMVSGVRAYDMALRLQYDAVDIKQVIPAPAEALRQFIADHPTTPKRIFCTYTAMLKLRQTLKSLTEVEHIS